MRLATLSNGQQTVVALEQDGSYFAWSEAVPDRPATSVLDLIQTGALTGAEPKLAGLQPLGADFRLLAPIPVPPRNIFCIGKNYEAHAVEFAASMNEKQAVPDHPIVFTKATTTVAGPHDTIEVDPAVTEKVDYEVELGIVIGRGGRYIAPEQAYDHIAGYTVINDLTARDWQLRHAQWFLGKSLDGFCPMGPVLVTADEIGDPAGLKLSLHVDGELRQEAVVRDMIFDIPKIISTISQVMTLQPGDIIATGTPEGVAVGFDPPRFLGDGAVVEARVDGIGVLRNRIKFAPRT